MRVEKTENTTKLRGLNRSESPPLIGDRIASMTKAVGIQPCGGCTKRQKWLNDKHQYAKEKFRELMKPKTEEV